MKWVFHEQEAGMIYSLMTYRQLVIYWVTKHLIASLYSDSNTQETMKRQVYPSDVASFLPLHKKKSHQESLL